MAACDRTVVVTGGFAEGEVFRINTLSCNRSEMNIYLTNMANAYEATFGEQIWTTSAGNTTIEDAFKETVLAKVTRDRYMLQMAEQYPQYGFEQHKGYGTKQHYAALLQYGPSPIHRMSFLKKLYG